MRLKIPQGKYVVGVSGGVDSMALLHLLVQQAKSQELRAKSQKKAVSSKLSAEDSTSLQLIVAHFNHGIRPDSAMDEEFVRQVAKRYNLPFEVGYGKLGPKASEERARKARYGFLNRIKHKHQAKAIVTAHHQDDLIETAILNILRGSGRRGLTAIGDNPGILRPMLHLPKKEILAYAKSNGLKWREDPSNQDERYLRNFVRRQIVPKLSNGQRRQLLGEIRELRAKNRIINQKIANLSQKIVKGKAIDRNAFIALPTEVAREVLMDFMRQNGIRGFDKKGIERLVVAVKTAKTGSQHEVTRGKKLKIGASKASLE